MSDRSETIRLTIDGKEIEVPKGSTVLQAAERAGLDVPRYCYHPGLSIAGNCRICLVDIEKMPKLVTSCTTPAADGMVVTTQGEKVEDGRRSVMQFLLANHPLDCPICDQAGECRLQDYSYQHGQGEQRFREERIKGFKQKPVGRHIMLDTERCIVCTRCVRFCDEVTATGELGVFQRGAFSYIDVFPDRALDNPYSGNTVDICPVGALTLKEFRFRKRVWWVKDVASVCGLCARGCSVNLGTADNRIHRITPRENPHVNRWWICDEGRLSSETLNAAARLTAAQARGADGAMGRIPFPEAIDRIAAAIAAARPGGVGVIASAALTLEDFWMLRRLVDEGLKDARVVVPEVRRGEDDAILIRADKTPNRRGAEMLGFRSDPAGAASLVADAGAGKIDVLMVLAGNGVAELPIEGIAALRDKATTFVATPFAGGMAEAAALVVPATAYGEFEGTWVNFEGHAQAVRRALLPKGVALEGWRVCAEILTRLTDPVGHETAADVIAEAAARVPALKGISPASLGALGTPL